MDIWNALSKNISSTKGPCGIGSPTTVFRLNRQIDYQKSETAYNFIKDFYNKYDLTHLYALNRALYGIIEATVPLIIYENYDSEDDFREIAESELGHFEEIRNIICLDELIRELWEVAEGEHWAENTLHTPPNMKILGELCLDIQKRIEDGEWELPEKTHAYMCSLTIGNYKRFDYESFTYQLSRKIDCNETIDNFIPYLQGDASDRELLYVNHHMYEAEVLRLIQWGKIGNVGDYLEDFYRRIKIFPPRSINEDSDDSVWKCLNAPFPLFRSDLAIRNLEEELTKYLFSCQLWLQNFPSQPKDDVLLHLAKITISAVYLFGACRLDVSKFDKSVLEKAGSYLQTHQLEDASFFQGGFPFINAIELNAMVVHALWISEAFGWERSTQRIYDWIIEQLDPYGVWYNFRYDGTGYITGVLLDTIELIKGGGEITFSMPQNKTKRVPSKAETTDVKIKTENRTVINNYIFNIFGKTNQSSGASPSTKDKVKSSTSTGVAKGKKFQKWKNCGDARLIFTDTDRFKFRYNKKYKELNIGHKSRYYELMIYLRDSELTPDMIKNIPKICPTPKTKPSEIVRQANESLNKKIRMLGYTDIPDNIKFIGLDKSTNRYRYYIPTKYEC